MSISASFSMSTSLPRIASHLTTYLFLEKLNFSYYRHNRFLHRHALGCYTPTLYFHSKPRCNHFDLFKRPVESIESFISAKSYARINPQPSDLNINDSETSVSIPLYEREPNHVCELDQVLAWRREARKISIALGDDLVSKDNGPTSQELLREIEWILDDCIALYRFTPTEPDTEVLIIDNLMTEPRTIASRWIECTWKNLQLIVENRVGIEKTSNSEPNEFKHEVRMRCDLESLYEIWKKRIQNREPFQYLISAAHWRDFILTVQSGVLIPRPETEQIIDLVEDAIKKNKNLTCGIWADLGTGSGAIAIGLANLLSEDARILAVDLSPIAVAVAKRNVERCNCQDKITVLNGDWFSPLEKFKGKLSGVVSNPPYIPAERIPNLQQEVRDHEPVEALDGGSVHGKNYLEKICFESSQFLKPGGFFALETDGGEQAKEILSYLISFPNNSFRDVGLIKDMNGIDRFVIAYRV